MKLLGWEMEESINGQQRENFNFNYSATRFLVFRKFNMATQREFLVQRFFEEFDMTNGLEFTAGTYLMIVGIGAARGLYGDPIMYS